MRVLTAAIVFVLLMGTLLPGAANATSVPPAATLTEAQTRAVDDLVNAQIAAHAVPGVVLGVAQYGRVLYAKGYGSRSLSPQAPVLAQSDFLIGSLTKQFTAASMLLLQQDGALSIDDPLSKYVPEYNKAAGITLRQMLNMVSGIPADNIAAFRVDDPTLPFTTEIEIARLNALPLDFAAGSQFKYSDAAYWLLGIVIERVSKMSYATFVERRIFEPLGMTSSYMYGRSDNTAEAAGHVQSTPGGPFTEKPDLRYEISFSPGAIVSNVGDMLRWDAAIRSDRLLRADSTNTMFKTPPFANGSPMQYAMGWLVFPDVTWHNGETFGFHSMNAVFPDGFDVVVLGNVNNTAFHPEALAVRIHNILNPAFEVSAFGVTSSGKQRVSLAGFAAPPAPDYSRANAWLALPGPASVLNEVPPKSGLSNLQASAPVDVFYLLPTTSQGNAAREPNQRFDDPDAIRFAKLVGVNQASAFNATARIYAPMYRGIKNDLWGAPFFLVQQPLELAYADTKAAFDYYIAHYNAGRPFIIVAHSQGDVDAYRLILEEIDGRPLERRMIAAYIIGQPLDASFFDDYRSIKSCQSATDSICMIGWQTQSKGMTSDEITSWAYDQYYWIPKKQFFGAPLPPFYPSINPIAWTNDPNIVSPVSANLGSVSFHPSYPPPKDDRLGRLLPGAVSAQSAPAATFVTPPRLPLTDYSITFRPNPPYPAIGVLHFYDFALFWMNLRTNVRDRTNAYLRTVRHVRYPLITSSMAVTGTVHAPFAFAVTTANHATKFSASGLPAGLTIDRVSGRMSGRAQQRGTFAVVLTATNSAGSSVGELAVTIR